MIRLAFAALLVVVLAGCGGASRSSLEEAADAAGAETSRFELSFVVKGAEALKEDGFTFQASGLFDYPNSHGVMKLNDPGDSADEFPTEFRLIGDSGYERWLFKGKTYWSKDDARETTDDPSELLVPFPGGPTTPKDVLTRISFASEKVDKLGNEDVRGIETTHYRAKVDGRRLLQQLPQSAKRHEPEEVWGDRFIPVEVWVDEQSRARRIRLTQDEGDEASSVMTIEFFDYGVEVDVLPPPADEVISQDELEKLQKEAWDAEFPTSESGDAEPANPEQVCKWAREELPAKDAEEFCRDVKEKQ